MTPNEMRIAIAEVCPFVSNTDSYDSGYQYYKNNTYQEFDPLNDLNSCHEMENVLTQHRRDSYGRKLACLKSEEGFDDTSHFTAAHATALQRAEAFLRTVGKWKEDK